MFRSFRLGSLLGFPIHVNVTFLLLLGVVGLTMGGLTAVAVVLLSFASVLLHELGHAVVARHLGVRVPRIELHFFGGAAQLADQPKSDGDEIAIAAAGPAVSFALAGLSLLLAQVAFAPFFQLLGTINLILGAFNLIPALPMDGGRILRAILSRRMGFLRATEVSAMVARGFAILLGAFGIVQGSFYLPILAVMLWLMTTAELAAARQRSARPFARFEDDDDPGFGRPASGPLDRWGGGPFRGARPTGFVIRRHGNRLVIDRLD